MHALGGEHTQYGWRFAESARNARWSTSPYEAAEGLESIVEFQVQIQGQNQREYEKRSQGWQNWTDENLATKLTKDDQQPVLLHTSNLLCYNQPGSGLTHARIESEGWWQRPQK